MPLPMVSRIVAPNLEKSVAKTPISRWVSLPVKSASTVTILTPLARTSSSVLLSASTELAAIQITLAPAWTSSLMYWIWLVASACAGPVILYSAPSASQTAFMPLSIASKYGLPTFLGIKTTLIFFPPPPAGLGASAVVGFASSGLQPVISASAASGTKESKVRRFIACYS